MADLIEKVYIDANVLVKGGFFLAKNIIMYASDEYKENASIVEATDKDNNIFEVTDFYGSPYVEYYISGGFTMIDGGGKITPEMLSDDLLERTFSLMNHKNTELMLELCKPDILVKMPFDSYGEISDYAKAREISDRGYQLMCEALERR